MRLGGLLVSLFFGMRLVGSVVGSKLVLGVTIVGSALQVGGSVRKHGSACAKKPGRVS